jgi:hypothetical protein
MYFISGSFFVTASLLMFFLIDLYSRTYDVMLSDATEVFRGFYSTNVIWFPIATGLIGILLITLHFLRHEKSE